MVDPAAYQDPPRSGPTGLSGSPPEQEAKEPWTSGPISHTAPTREGTGIVCASISVPSLPLPAPWPGPPPWAAEADLAGLLHDIGKYGDLFQGRLRGEQAGIDHWSLGVSSPTVFRHDCRTFTHLATGCARHIAKPCETRREGPLAAESESGSHHESDHRRSRLGSIQTPVATDRFQVRRVTPASQLLTLVFRRLGFPVSWTTDTRRVQDYCPRNAQPGAFPVMLPGSGCCRNRNTRLR
jgi:hypothetical protein